MKSDNLAQPASYDAMSLLMKRAREAIPGGVNSANRQLPFPFVIRSAHGAYLRDVTGRQYIDYHAAFGPCILGHCDRRVDSAVRSISRRLDLVGAGVTEVEIELAGRLRSLIPSADRVLLTNSGSEATYAALRLARAVTGRKFIVKFQGAYHGWHDAIALNVISTADALGRSDPLSLGMDPDVIAKTIVLPWNDIDVLSETMARVGDDVAALIVEVIPHNIGCVLPKPGFLEAAKGLCTAAGAVLIFDEVVTGFRHGLGGYQKISGVVPDVSVFAKAMGNGYPIAALVGREDLMDRFSPGGGVFFAGTFNGHPVGAAAALATISALSDGMVYRHTFELGEFLANGLHTIAREAGVPMTVAKFGSVVVPYFLEGNVESYADLLRNNTAIDLWFRTSMCHRGVFMLPTALKRNHISAAHTRQDIDVTLERAREVFRAMPAGLA